MFAIVTVLATGAETGAEFEVETEVAVAAADSVRVVAWAAALAALEDSVDS